MESVEEIIRLREEAIRNLLDERAQLESRLQALSARLRELDDQLQRLGYEAGAKAGSAARVGGAIAKQSQATRGGQVQHTIQQHLEGKSSHITQLFSRLSHEIRQLSEGVRELPLKHTINYRTGRRNFCGVVVQASKLWAYVDISHSELLDPQGISEDCSAVGRWATGSTRFRVRSEDEVGYAMSLIQQAYELHRQDS